MSQDSVNAVTPEQCRAARALLNWSQDQLAERSKVSKKAIADFERGARQPQQRTLRDLRGTLAAAGVEFIAVDGEKGEGVRFAQRDRAALSPLPGERVAR